MIDIVTPGAKPARRPALVARAGLVRQDVARTALLVAAGVAFLALLAQVRLQVGIVPVTGQTFGVLLLGAAFGARLSVVTVATYGLLGVAGLPIFTGGGAGMAHLLGPTGGYLIGFVVAAGLLGELEQRGWLTQYLKAAAAMVIATLAIYVCGVAWLMATVGLGLAPALAAGVVPFLAGDVIKLVLAVSLLAPVSRAVRGK